MIATAVRINLPASTEVVLQVIDLDVVPLANEVTVVPAYSRALLEHFKDDAVRVRCCCHLRITNHAARVVVCLRQFVQVVRAHDSPAFQGRQSHWCSSCTLSIGAHGSDWLERNSKKPPISGPRPHRTCSSFRYCPCDGDQISPPM